MAKDLDEQVDAFRTRPLDADQEPEAETLLYDGFTSDRDRRLLPAIREADGVDLTASRWPLEDQRLTDMLSRYRARNFPDSLNAAEQAQWQAFCRQKLSGEVAGAPITLGNFMQEIQKLLPEVDGQQGELLDQWQLYATELATRLGISAP